MNTDEKQKKEINYNTLLKVLEENKKLKEEYELKSKILNNLNIKKDSLIETYSELIGFKSEEIPENQQNSNLQNPIIYREGRDFLAVLNLGCLPPVSNKNFYNKMHIFPIGYKIIRNLKLNSYEVFVCEISMKDNDIIFSIKHDNEEIKGGFNIWKDFKKKYGIHYNLGLEDFLGLNINIIQERIEEMGNMDLYDEYISLKYR